MPWTGVTSIDHGTKRSGHVTPILTALQPVSFSIDFKILPLVFKALNGMAPAHICDWLSPYDPDHCLRSTGRALLRVPKSWLVRKSNFSSLSGCPRCGALCLWIWGRQTQYHPLTLFLKPTYTLCFFLTDAIHCYLKSFYLVHTLNCVNYMSLL